MYPVKRSLVASLIAMALPGACGRQVTEVDDPFYLTYPENPDDMALFRCLDGPNGACAGDGLPDATIFESGASKQYMTVARHPRADGVMDLRKVEYFYFRRVPQELKGWGQNPENILGPLSEAEFAAAKARLGLPDLTITP